VVAIRSLIGAAYAAGTIDQLTTYGYGIEGGMSLCVERTRFSDSRQFEALKSAIDAIPFDASRTSKSTQFEAACPKRTTP
jgi:hypothetical protein